MNLTTDGAGEAPSCRCCTYGVDVAEREVVDVEFLRDIERSVDDDCRFV